MLEITAALNGVKSTLDLLRVAIAARDSAKIEAAMQDMTGRLTDALMSGLAAVEKAQTLQTALVTAERRNAELEQELVDRAMYELHELRPGAFAYRSKSTLDRPEQPQHYLCQACRDSGLKTILQYVHAVQAWDTGIWKCPRESAHDIADRGC